MEESKQFSRLVKPVQRQLFWLLLWKEGQLFLLGAAVWAVVLYLLARILVFPFIVHFLFIGWLILGMINVYRIWRKRPSMREASLLFNQYVPEDRVITALSFLQQEGEMERLQLRDAVRHMKIYEQDVWKRKKKVFYPTWLVAAVLFGGAAMLSALFPNEAMLEANKEEKVAKIMDEAEQELKQKAKETKDPAAEKALQEAKKKLAEVNNPEKALTELEKITKQLDLQVMKQKEKQKQLEAWQQQANNAGLHDLAKLLEQKDLEKLEQELKRLNQGWNELTNKQKEALSQLTEQQEQLTEEQLQVLVAQLKTALQSGELSKQLAQASGKIQQVGQQVQKQLADNGMPTKLGVSSGQNQNASPPTSNQSSAQIPNQGQGSGQNGQSSQAGGSGTGSSPRAGTGTGAGNGAGSGQGGTFGGIGQGSREMLTIPEVTEGQENRESDSGKLGEGSSQQQTAEDAPVLKGSLRNYEEVYEQYGESYRESTERLRLPADLTNIVKEYYEQLDPER